MYAVTRAHKHTCSRPLPQMVFLRLASFLVFRSWICSPNPHTQIPDMLSILSALAGRGGQALTLGGSGQ